MNVWFALDRRRKPENLIILIWFHLAKHVLDGDHWKPTFIKFNQTNYEGVSLYWKLNFSEQMTTERRSSNFRVSSARRSNSIGKNTRHDVIKANKSKVTLNNHHHQHPQMVYNHHTNLLICTNIIQDVCVCVFSTWRKTCIVREGQGQQSEQLTRADEFRRWHRTLVWSIHNSMRATSFCFNTIERAIKMNSGKNNFLVDCFVVKTSPKEIEVEGVVNE